MKQTAGASDSGNVGHSGFWACLGLVAFCCALEGCRGDLCPGVFLPPDLYSYSTCQVESEAPKGMEAILSDYSLRDLQASKGLVGLRLRHSNLVILQERNDSFADATNLTLLLLENVTLDALTPPDVKPFVSKSVYELRILSCQGVHAWKFHAESFSNLKTLRILDSGLFYVSGELAGLGSLRRVTIRNSRVSWLATGAFGNQTALEWLALDGNNIQALARDQLPRNATALWYLNLSGNKLRDLSDLDLNSLPSLRELHLSNNQLLQTLPDLKNRKANPQLAELWLQGLSQLKCADFCWLFCENRPLSDGLGWTGIKCTDTRDNAVTLEGSLDPPVWCPAC